MKRTQLLLIMLLTLASSVWGAEIATLSFVYSNVGHPDGQSAPQKCNDYDDKDKVIMNSDFSYSMGKDVVCNSSNGGEIDDYLMVKSSAKACSRQTYNFPGGDVKLTLDCKCRYGGTYTGPTVTIDGSDAIFGSISLSNNEQKNVEVTISGVSAGDHDISVVFAGSDKFYVKTLKLSYEATTTYALTLTSDANGEAHSNQGNDAAIPENASVTITATPKTGYKFVNWTGTSTETSNPFNFTMNADKSYCANFAAAAQYTITVNAGANGSASGSGTYYEGSQQTITATPNTGYEFSQWNDGNKENPRTITVTGNATYTASFAKVSRVCTNTKTIVCKDEVIGTIDYAKNTGWSVDGKNESYATPSTTGYVFSGTGQENKSIYYAFETSDNANVTVTVKAFLGIHWAGGECKIYSTVSSGERKFNYEGDDYYEKASFGMGNQDGSWKNIEQTCNSLSAGKYVIALRATNWQGMYFEQITLTANVDVFCTAVPPSSTYTITYDHGTNGTGSIAAGEKTEGENFTLSSSTFSRNGYRQTGWATTDGGAKAYNLGDTYTEDADITLYPVWEEDLTTVWYMKGTFVDDWGTRYDFVKAAGHSTESVASVTMENLAKNTAYWFKLWDDRNDYGQSNAGGKMTYNNNTWTLNGGWDVGMQTTAAGNYTFTVDFSGASPVLTISYPNCYTITYNKNDEGATGSMDAEGYIEEGGNRTLPAVGFSKAHWHFLGWATSAEGEVVYADEATIENIREDINLYAKWAIDRFDVVYNNNGVDGYKGELPATVTYDYDTEVAISDVVLEKFGYTFVGWNTNSAATTAESGTFHVTANKTFYAIWQVTKPTSISIRPEDNKWSVDKGTSVQMIATLTPDANTMAIENRELTWSSSDATRAFVNQEGYVSFVGTGSATITATSKVDGSVHDDYNFTINAGSCSGWEISSYHEDKSNQKFDYFKQVGSSNEWRCAYVLPNSSDKFWIGNCDGWWDSQYGGHSQEWTFDWLRLADRRDNNYYPGQDAVGELVIWDNSNDNNWGVAFLPNYRMSYMLNGSQWRIMNFHNVGSYEYETEIFRVPAGYKDNSGMKCYVGIQKANGDNMEVRGKSAQVAMNTIGGLSGDNMAGKYGKWHIYSNSNQQNWYCQFIYYNNVTFEMNGGAGNIDPIYGKNGANETFNTGDLTNPTRTGYTLTRWKDQHDNTYTLNQDVTISSDLVLTAQWAPATYTITLDKNNGAADGTATATFESTTLTSVTHVSRTGYTLTGYFTEAAAGSMVITAGGALVANVANYTDESGSWIKPADATLYAQWQAKQYTVTLDNQGATTAGQASVTATYDAAMPSIAENLPAKTGYTFGGYYDAENGAGTQYYTAEGASAHAWDKADAATLYAKWTADTYSISYTLNGGVNNVGNPESYTIESEDIALAAPTKTNYTFVGWYTEAGFVHQITTIAHGTTGDKSLFAKWTPTPFNITYYLDGGTNNANNPATYTVESAEIALLDPTKDGYDFQGWYADSEFQTPSNTIAAGSTGDKTFYAKWAVNPCTNTLTIQCEDNPIKIGDLSPNYKLGDGWHSGADGNYVDYNNNAGKELFYAVSLPAGTYTMTVRAINAGQAKLRFYKKGAGSDITYNTNNYGKLNKTQDFNVGWNSKGTFSDYDNNVGQLDEGDYLLGLYAEGGYAAFDKIVITATTLVFCPTKYTVTFDQPANGSVSASIVGGAAIESGTQVLEGTRVVFTCTPNDGYDFVKYNDGTNDIVENPYTATVNSDLTITTTIELAVVKHNLTASADANGSVSPTALEVGEGREATITATPDANYRFDHWTAVGYDLTDHESDNPLIVTMPTNDVALTAYFVFDEVHDIIATGTSANYNGNQEGDGATLTITAMEDPLFDHDVMKFEYSNMTSHYAGKSIFKDGGYTPTSKATGFAFWYKTEKADDQVAFCFQKTEGQQVKWQMAATNGVWKYYYFADAAAANYATDANLKIYMNGEDNGNTTRYNEGAYYITEIQATNVTSMPDKAPQTYTITLDANGGEANGSATATLNSSALTSVTHVERTGYDLTGYFTERAAGSMVITSEGALVENVDGYTDGSANWTKESDATLYAQWQAKVTHVTANANGGAYAGGTCNGDFSYGCSVVVSCFPEKDDYNFQGYTLTQDGDDYIFDEDGAMVDRAGYVAGGQWIYEGENLTIYAKWISATTYYEISVAASPEDKGTVTMKVGEEDPTSNPVHVLAGTEITLKANCTDPTFAFKQWQDGNRENPRTITATANATYTATFEKFYSVTANWTKPGVEVTGQGNYFYGDQVTLTAVAGTTDSIWGQPYELQYGLREWTNVSGVTITGHEHDNPITFTMSAAHVTMTATYAPVECTNTKTIQCEDPNAFIPFNSTNIDETNKNRIPHVGKCGPYDDYYTNFHGTGYYDYKAASQSEMFYPVTLPAGTYQFEVWSAANDDKNMWMNIYVEDPDGSAITYNGVHYTKVQNKKLMNFGNEPLHWPFKDPGVISNVTLTTTKSVIVGLYAGLDYAAFDQIVITADNNVFCEPISTEQFTIEAGQNKEVPVCGVANLTIYEGGQANNVDDFEVTYRVEYKRTTTALDKWETFCVPFNCSYIAVYDGEYYTVYPTYFPTEADRTANQNQQLGYYFMEELADRNQTVMGEEFKQRWEVLVGMYPVFDKAYITKFPSSQSDGYFLNKEMTYRGDAQTILGKAHGALVQEVAQDVPKFYYYPNNTMSTLTLDGDAYILNEAGTNFDLQTNPVIKPFSCYIQATEEYKRKHRSLRMGDVLEGEQGGTITTGLEQTGWTLESLIADPATRVYDMLGREVTTSGYLPTGVYMLVNGETNVKYFVK